MSVCAKFQLSSWSRSGWKVCGSGWVVGWVVGWGGWNTWLLCLTLTLVALELFWVGLSYVGFWQHIFRHISYASPGSFYLFLPINLVGRFRTRYWVLGGFTRFYNLDLLVCYLKLSQSTHLCTTFCACSFLFCKPSTDTFLNRLNYFSNISWSLIHSVYSHNL